MQAKAIMTKSPITVTEQTEITKVATLLLEKRINGVPVVNDEGKLVGIICQSDIVAQQKQLPMPSLFTFLDGYISLQSPKHMEKAIRKIAATLVIDAMTPNPVTVSPDSDIEAIAALMVDHNFHTLPVVENGHLVGVIGKEDVLRTLIPKNRATE
ncbi:CBS domain-containing protein [Desulfosarcina sp. OttesenSCG-928-A07]|nr:CBS domain-containing protein [Desulfosarcina sp. OttesenSCG-928-G17]MDL2329598.1 CBS domain-containing protein [Desulfosarcina sp. OttesenSCG-928-A07]